MNKAIKIGLIAITALLMIYGVVRLTMYKYVQPNEIGIWMTNGGYNASDYQVWTGYFPVDFTPMTKSFVIPGQPWTIDMPKKTIYSKQKGEWDIDPQLTFRVDREQGPLVCFRNSNLLRNGQDSLFFKAVGNHLLAVIVNDVFNEIIGLSNDSTLMSNTYVTQRIIEDSVRVRLLRVGYILESFLSNLNPPASIIAKNRAKNEAESATLTAKADVIKADAEAKVSVAQANAAAQVAIIEAKADAEVVRLAQEAKTTRLTPLLLQLEWINKWDGALPYYQTGSNTSMMMNMK